MSPRPWRAARAPRRGPLWLAAVILPAVAVSACTTPLRSADAPEKAPPSVSPTDANLDLSRLPVPRTDFCGALSRRDVTPALDGPVTATAHYGNGDEFEVRPGYRDVSHEYGCVFEGRDGAVARTWVFARPVSDREARMLVQRERRGRGCSFPDSVRFGSPGLTSVCEMAGPDPSVRHARARLEGLFRDSWLACEVSGPARDRAPVDVLRRAEDWCTAVVTTVGAEP